MRRAVRDYRYEAGENRMTEECSQYLAQLQKDWERQRVKLGVEALRKSVSALSLVDYCVSYRSRLLIVERVTLISMTELQLTRLLKLPRQFLNLNPTRLLTKSLSMIYSRERLIKQNGHHRSLLRSLGNSLILDTCYRFSFHPTQYTWARYPSYRRRNTSIGIVVKQRILGRQVSTAPEWGVWNGRPELENSESWGRRYSTSWANPPIQVTDGSGPRARSKSETRLNQRVRVAAKLLTRTQRRTRFQRWKPAIEQNRRN